MSWPWFGYSRLEGLTGYSLLLPASGRFSLQRPSLFLARTLPLVGPVLTIGPALLPISLITAVAALTAIPEIEPTLVPTIISSTGGTRKNPAKGSKNTGTALALEAVRRHAGEAGPLHH